MNVEIKESLSKMICEDTLPASKVAQFLHISTKTLEGLRNKGGGPYYIDVNEKVKRYPRIACYQWAVSRLRKSTSDDGSQVQEILKSLEKFAEEAMSLKFNTESLKQSQGRPRSITCQQKEPCKQTSE